MQNLSTKQCFTLTQDTEGMFESKGSKFLAFIFPIECDIHAPTPKLILQHYIQALKPKHTKAVHFVSAMRAFAYAQNDNTEASIIESSSDDGETKGSSGVPCLNVLRGECLVNVGCVVVRYFGGTLLGVGGLVRAYTAATHAALHNAKAAHTLIPFIQKHTLTLCIPYAQFSKIQYLAKNLDITLSKQNFRESSIEILCSGTQKALDTLKNTL